MEEITLYRGIAVPYNKVDETKKTIENNGITDKVKLPLLSDDMKKTLMKKERLSFADTRQNPLAQEQDWSFVTGDKEVAAFYAQRSRGNLKVPCVIEFTAKMEDLALDVRDFLATAFHTPTRDDEHAQLRLKYLKLSYGEKVEQYWNKAKEVDEFEHALGCVDLAQQDPDLVRHHFSTSTVIEGRHVVPIRSVFLVKSPIPPSNITSVTQTRSSGFDFDLRLNEWG